MAESVYANASNNANIADAPSRIVTNRDGIGLFTEDDNFVPHNDSWFDFDAEYSLEIDDSHDAYGVLLPWKDPRYRDFHSDPVPRIDINTVGNALYEIDDEFDENLWQATVTELRRLDNLSEDPNLPKRLDMLEGYSTLAQCTNFVFQIQDWETIAREVARIQLCWNFRNACLLYAIKRALPRSVAQRLLYTPDQHAYLLWEDFLTYRLKLNHPLHLSLAEQEKHEELLKLDRQNKRIGRDWEPNENDHCCNP